MNQEQKQNNTIVKNTMYLYIRTFLTMVLSIYTSRVVLQVLGVEDYGIYNVVGGIVVLFTFINNSLITAKILWAKETSLAIQMKI